MGPEDKSLDDLPDEQDDPGQSEGIGQVREGRGADLRLSRLQAAPGDVGRQPTVKVIKLFSSSPMSGLHNLGPVSYYGRNLWISVIS